MTRTKGAFDGAAPRRRPSAKPVKAEAVKACPACGEHLVRGPVALCSGCADDLERRVVKRLRAYPPASFSDLVQEGIIRAGQESTIWARLKDRLVVVGKRPSRTGRGRPHVLYTVAKDESRRGK